MLTFLWMACAGDGKVPEPSGETAVDSGALDSESGGGDTGGAVDPLALADAVSEAELRTSIEALEAFGTRHTRSTGDDAARDYLADRLEAYGLDVEFDDFTAGSDAAANVIGYQHGSDPDAVYIFQAHYDSTS